MTDKGLPNLFTALSKWANRQEENYITEAFACVLRRLLHAEPHAGVELVQRLCSIPHDHSMQVGQEIQVRTEVSTPSGRLDLCIESDLLLGFVELKKESELHLKQLARYGTELERRKGVKLGRLILLTAYPPRFVDDVRPDVALQWDEVANWLDELKCRPELSAASQFLVAEFVQFLRDKFMASEHVDSHEVAGTRALDELILMLGRVVREYAKEEFRPGKGTYQGRKYRGFMSGASFWTGIYVDEPHVLLFMELAPGPGDVWNDLIKPLDLKSEKFFDLSTSEQVRFLATFVNNGICRVRPDATPSDAASAFE